MARFLHIILIALSLLLMGARDLPRPCLGDGLGNACAVNQCQCTSLCSCRSVCSTDATAPAAEIAMGESCHMHAADTSTAAPRHFSLPEPPAPTLLVAAWLGPLFPRVAPARLATTHRLYPAPSLNPPEPPPRSQG